MAQPQKDNSQIFEQDQQPVYRVLYWDTVYPVVQVSEAHGDERDTAFGTGIEFALFDLLVPSFNPASKAELDAALGIDRDGNGNRVLSLTRSILDYDENDQYRTGVTPLMYHYWGAGTIDGGSRAKHVLLRYAGYVKHAYSEATLVFGGQGNVRAYVNGAEVVSGRVREPTLTSWGYQYNTTPISLSQGDYVEVYYWQTGEPWGGFFGKLIPHAVTTDTLLASLRDAPVIGTSIISKEEDNIPAMEVPNVLSLEIERDTEGIPKATLEVPVTAKGEADGYYYENGTLVSNETGLVLKADRVIHARTGYRRPNGTDELYNRFTGVILDILPPNDGVAEIQLQGFETLMSNTADTNIPDFLSYHAAGYVRRQQSNEPVFGVPAYDNWDLEVALADLCYHAGIDPYALGKVKNTWGRSTYRTFTNGDLYYGAKLFSARALVDGDLKVRIERQVNYGNVGPYRDPALPPDDTYLFNPDIQRNVYDRAKEISNHYGYDFYFNADGFCVIGARNNPVAFQLMTRSGDYMTVTDGEHEMVHPSAVGARYFYRTFLDNNWTRTIQGKFSRLDLYMGVGPDPLTGYNGGIIKVLVERQVAPGVYETVPGFPSAITSFLDIEEEKFYYDDVTYETGENAAVVTLFQLPFDDYRVTLSPLGPHPGEVTAAYRINGVGVYEHDAFGSAYYAPNAQPYYLSTLQNVLGLTPESGREELRNHVIVVGARKATITDSAKVANDPGDNNPDAEFHVAVAVDPFSIYDPTSANFVGQKRMVVNFDSKISDSDFARWLTRVILYRYRNPKSTGTAEHTALPNLDIRDPIYITNEQDRSIDGRYWIVGITETYKNGEARTELELFPYPEIPSYQPREEVDVDELFDGSPVINVRISYENIYGEEVTNSDLSDPANVEGFYTRLATQNAPMHAEAVTNANTHVAQNKVIPETVYLSWNIDNTDTSKNSVPTVAGTFVTPRQKKRALVNNPYRHFFHVTSWTNGVPTFAFDFQEGDGSTSVYDKAYYGFPNIDGQYYLCYDALKSNRPGRNPFYDPYSSEVGKYIRIQFTALVSGRYRVSVWDARRAGGWETPVAWLTVPGAESNDPNAHWVHLEPSAQIEFLWDGVDNIGEWNRRQSKNFAREIEGAFGEGEELLVGRGFYAWNDETTNLHTLIGDDTPNNFDADGAPRYTIGKFGQFYVKIEVLNDELLSRDVEAGIGAVPRVVRTDSLKTTANQNDEEQVYIYTHLPEPTQVGIKVEDYVGATPWQEGMAYNPSDWQVATDVDATIREGKPVRITFHPVARRGYHFEDPDVVTAKLTKLVHLKATVLDQFWTLKGSPWQVKAEEMKNEFNYIEEKRLTSRMFHNEDHTIAFKDDAWFTGSEIKQMEWIFNPSDFKKDFGDGVEEELAYGDYEQLEVLPGFTARPGGGIGRTERSYMLMAYMSYIFYLSAFTLDRSGRRQWCIRRYEENGQLYGFVDKSKIVTPAWRNASGDPSDPEYNRHYLVDYPRVGADRYLVRTLVARQWVEPSWANPSSPHPSSPIAQHSTQPWDTQHYQFVQQKYKDFWFRSSAFADGAQRVSTADRHLVAHGTIGTSVNEIVTWRNQRSVTAYDSQYILPFERRLGSWTFDRPGVENFYTPSPGRDFHPYWRAALMADWATSTPNRYLTDGGFDAMAIPTSNFEGRMRDANTQDNYFALTFSEKFAEDFGGFNHWGLRLEWAVEDWIKDKRTVDQVKAAFNYVRQDMLDRYEGFRGCYTSGPIPDRFQRDLRIPAHQPHEMSYVATTRKTPRQPVMPSGIYFVNLGNYKTFLVGRPTAYSDTALRHFVDEIYNHFDMRFRSEYIWYADGFFPVSAEGQAVYGYTWNEYTKAFEWIGAPWWASRTGSANFERYELPELFYDSGAWVGWKDDVATWNGNQARLRWAYNGILAVNSHQSQRHSGGAGYTGTTGTEQYWGMNLTFTHANILDEYQTASIMRLAVGPRVPETADVIMNLVLPSRLRG